MYNLQDEDVGSLRTFDNRFVSDTVYISYKPIIYYNTKIVKIHSMKMDKLSKFFPQEFFSGGRFGLLVHTYCRPLPKFRVCLRRPLRKFVVNPFDHLAVRLNPRLDMFSPL